MGELQVAEHVEVLVPLDRHKAEVLDGRIRRLAKQAGEQLVQVGRLLDEAQAGRVHETLGFPSWTAYVADALGGQLQLSGEARQAMVQLMAGEGMSVRAIASATGSSKSTVARDLEEVSHNGTPDSDAEVSHDGTPDDGPSVEPATVTGLDGKQYRKSKPQPQPKDKGDKSAPRRRRPNVRKFVEDLMIQMNAFAGGLGDIDPAEVNAEELRDDLNEIDDALGALRKFVDAVRPQRQPQIRSGFRLKVMGLAALTEELEEMTADPRWAKAATRFSADDRINLDRVINRLTTLHHTVCSASKVNVGGRLMPSYSELDASEYISPPDILAAEPVD